MRFKSKPLQTGAEVKFFNLLQNTFPDHYIAVQVAMSALVEAIEYKDRSQFRTYYVDYVICDKNASRPLLVVELDDPTHNRDKAKERDARKNAVLADAGVPIYRVDDCKLSSQKLHEKLAPLLNAQKTLIENTTKTKVPEVKKNASEVLKNISQKYQSQKTNEERKTDEQLKTVPIPLSETSRNTTFNDLINNDTIVIVVSVVAICAIYMITRIFTS